MKFPPTERKMHSDSRSCAPLLCLLHLWFGNLAYLTCQFQVQSLALAINIREHYSLAECHSLAELCNHNRVNNTSCLGSRKWLVLFWVGEPWGARKVVMIRDKWQSGPRGKEHSWVPPHAPFLPQMPQGTSHSSGVIVNYSKIYNYLQRMQPLHDFAQGWKDVPNSRVNIRPVKQESSLGE